MWIILTSLAPLPLLLLGQSVTGVHWLLLLPAFQLAAYVIGRLYFGAWAQRGGWLTELARTRINYRLRPAQTIDKSKNYIFACHPHHVMSFSMILSFIKPGASETFVHFLVKKPVALVSDSVFFVDLLGLYLRLAGARPASRDVANELLSRGESIALNPGGTREMAINRSSGQRCLKLIRRTSFLSHALKHRVPVVPILSMGEENAYRHWHILDWIHPITQRYLDYPAPLLSTGYFSSFFPNACTVNAVMGEPVIPEADDDLASFSEKYYTSLKEIAFRNNYNLRILDSKQAL